MKKPHQLCQFPGSRLSYLDNNTFDHFFNCQKHTYMNTNSVQCVIFFFTLKQYTCNLALFDMQVPFQINLIRLKKNVDLLSCKSIILNFHSKFIIS